jgi:integrase
MEANGNLRADTVLIRGADMASRLTDKAIRDLPAPATGSVVAWDSEVRGFGLRTTAACSRSFVLNYRANGRERRITIGSYPDWPLAKARERARVLKVRVDQGEDPMSDRHAERAAPTVADLADRFLEDAKGRCRPRSVAEYESLIRQLVVPKLGGLRVGSVTRLDVEAFHREVSRVTRVRANRALSLLRAMFFQAVRSGLRADNPAQKIARNAEHHRERFLTLDELHALFRALDNCRDQGSADALRLMVVTGARRGEVLNATWSQFDLTAGLWVKPASATKQNRVHRVPLNATARALLGRMAAEATGPLLFPGRRVGAAQTTLKRTWATVCVRAGITGLRVHDLRHSYASFLASAGLSLPTIGALLGHSSPATTNRYAHLLDRPLRDATEHMDAIVDGAKSND